MADEGQCRSCGWAKWESYHQVGECAYPVVVVLPSAMRVIGEQIYMTDYNDPPCPTWKPAADQAGEKGPA